MIAALILAQAVGGGFVAPYAQCLQDRINADPRMVKLPETQEERIAIFDAAKAGCADIRARVPSTEATKLEAVDESMRKVLLDPAAAEAEHGTDPLDDEGV